MKPPKIVVIVGQTASGKSDVAMNLAQKHNGEIICLDSRTVYKGMDIGTSKPSKIDQADIRHHLLDVVSPDEQFSVADAKRLCNQTIKDISDRGKIPFLVGGTGLYINSIVYDFQLGNKRQPLLRDKLEKLPIEDLQRQARELQITEKDVNFQNKRHLARSIERGGVIKSDTKLRKNCLMIGLDVDQDDLKSRIKDRINKMINDGLEKEVRTLEKKYGFDAAGMNSIGYKEWKEYFAGEQSIEDLKQKLYKNTWQYARRQKTWFKRDKNIHRTTSVNDASRVVEQFLIQ